MRLSNGPSSAIPTAYDKKYAVKKPYQPTVDNGRSAYLRKNPVVVKPRVAYTPPKRVTVAPKTVYKAPATASIRTANAPVQAAHVASAVPVAPTAPTNQSALNDLMKQYLGEGTSDVNKIYDQQKTAQLAQIKAQQDAALGKIKQQQAGTQQDYYNQRNQADVVSTQNVQRLRELMAANGNSMSGENITANASMNSDRQNSLNALNTQEQAQMNDYSNQINDINNPAKQQAAIAQIESERAKALVDAKNTATEKAWRQYTFNNMSASEKATLEWAKTQYGEDAAWKMYELKYNGEMQKATNQAQISAYTGFNTAQGGGGTAQFQSDMSNAVQKGVPASYAPIMTEIAKRESSWNPKALNKSSGTYGYGQFQEYNVDSYNKKYGLDYRNNPTDQLVAMYHYIQDRYGTPEKALAFWNANHWY